MSTKVLNEKIFTETWCPLFGELPLFRDSILITSIIKCIVDICQARDIWEAKDEEDYPESKLNIAQSIYKKAVTLNDDIHRDELFFQARKMSKLLFDHVESDYHAFAIMSIDKAWQALCGMLKDGKPETDAGIMKQVFDADRLIGTANILLSDVKQIKLKDKVNAVEATLEDKKGLIRETLKASQDTLASTPQTQGKTKDVLPFPTPTGTQWHEVNIYFIDSENVKISARDKTETKHFFDMGFRKGKTCKPVKSWDALFAFSKKECFTYPQSLRSKTEKDIQDLRKRLKAYFGIQDNPIIFKHGYEPVFKVCTSNSEDENRSIHAYSNSPLFDEKEDE